jgi:hypothetical protein
MGYRSGGADSPGTPGFKGTGKFEMKKKLDQKELEKCELTIVLAQRDQEKQDLQRKLESSERHKGKLMKRMGIWDEEKVHNKKVLIEKEEDQREVEK